MFSNNIIISKNVFKDNFHKGRRQMVLFSQCRTYGSMEIIDNLISGLFFVVNIITNSG